MTVKYSIIFRTLLGYWLTSHMNISLLRSEYVILLGHIYLMNTLDKMPQVRGIDSNDGNFKPCGTLVGKRFLQGAVCSMFFEIYSKVACLFYLCINGLTIVNR